MRYVFCAIALSCTIIYAGDDWRVQAFESAQALFADFDARESSFLIKAAPETKPFYDLWLPMKEARRKLDLIAFKYKVEHLPETIDWSNVWLWSEGTSSTEEEKQLILALPAYALANTAFEPLRNALLAEKGLFKIRNDAYKRNETSIRPFEAELQESLMKLQSEVEPKRTANKTATQRLPVGLSTKAHHD